MSELNSIYFAKNEYTITDFVDIYLNHENISEKVDKVIVTYVAVDKYGIEGYKNDKLVELLPNGVYAKSVGYCHSYFPNEHGGLIYEIEY